MTNNIFALPQLICSFYILATGITILAQAPKLILNRLFFLLSLSTFLWLSFYSTNYLLSTLNNIPNTIFYLYRVSYCGITFLSVAFYHFITTLIKDKQLGKLVFVNYLYGFLMSFLLIKTNYIISGLNHYSWGYYPKSGHFHPFFLAYFLFLVLLAETRMILAVKNRTIPNKESFHIKYFAIGFTIFSTACVDFLPNYGINIYPMGFIPSTIFMLMIAYGIFKYQILDARIVIKRNIVYSILIAIISIAYLLTILILEKVAQGVLGYRSILISIGIAFILGVGIIPIRNKLQKIIDRYFFKGTPLEIASQNERLIQEIAKTEKYKLLSTFSSGIAHEVKNPLTAIKTFADHLPQRLNDKDFLLKFSRIVGKEVDRMDNLVHQLIDYGKPAPLSLKNTNIHKFIDETIDIFNSRIVTQRINLVKNYSMDKKLMLEIDQNQIRQALMNILLNAFDAMPAGGELTVATFVPSHPLPVTRHPSPVTSNTNDGQLRTGDQVVIISIKDTGSGIAPVDLPHIFDPFFSKKDSGTGLGLPITQTIIQNHGGKIHIISTEGKGTEVVLELPLARQEKNENG